MKNRPSRDFRHLLGHDQRGYTILEVMFVVAVVSILMGLAVPSFISVIRNNRIVSQNNEFIGALNYARSEAIRRGETVSLCSSTNSTSCSTTTNWSTGWITFVDLNADGILNGAEVVMQVSPPALAGITLNGAAGLTNVRFAGNGMLSTSSPTGAFTLKKSDCTSGLYARTTTVAATGRVSTVKSNCT